MRNIKIRKEDVGNFAKNTGKVLLYGLAIVLPRLTSKDVIDTIRYSGDVGYSDAVRAIMESDMFSSSKDEMIGLLKKDQNMEYYKSIIQVARSDMFSSNKVNIIKKFNSES